MAPIASNAPRPRGHVAACQVAVAPVVASAMRIAAILAALLALPASSAVAQSAAAVEGRWRSQEPALTLDMARCAEGFCGMAVDASGQCGRRVLTFAALAPPAGLQPSGRLQLPEHRAPLDARVALALQRPGAPPSLEIAAVEAGSGAFMRRVFPFQAWLVRIGDAACAVQPVS